MSKTAPETSAEAPQRVVIGGKPYVFMDANAYVQLMADAGRLGELPPADASGHRDAIPTMRAMIGNELASARKAAGLTQTALAEAAGVRQATVSAIERGLHTPTEATIDALWSVIEEGKSAQPAIARRASRRAASRSR